MNYFQFKTRYPHARPHAFVYAVSGAYETYRDDLYADIKRRHRKGDLDYWSGDVGDEISALNILGQQTFGRSRFIEIGDFTTWKTTDLIGEWIQKQKYPRTVVLFKGSKKPSTNSIFAQSIIKTGWWVVCNKPLPEAMSDYLSEVYKLSEEAASSLSYYSSGDIARARSIVTKLTHMTDGRHPTHSDIVSASSGYEGNVFTSIDSLLSFDFDQAIENFDPSQINAFLTLLRLRLIQIIQIRKMGENIDISYLTDVLNIPHFRVSQVLKQSSRLSSAECVSILRKVAETEEMISIKGFRSEVSAVLFIMNVFNLMR